MDHGGPLLCGGSRVVYEYRTKARFPTRPWPKSWRHSLPLTPSHVDRRSPCGILCILRTLPGDKQVDAKEVEDIGSDDVRRVVNHTIQMLRNPAQSGENRYLRFAISTHFSMRKSSQILRSSTRCFGRTGRLYGRCVRAATIQLTASPCERRCPRRQTTRILSLRFSRHYPLWKKADTAWIWCGKRE